MTGVLVVGASLAGAKVVEGLRTAGFDGPVRLLGAEPHLPYDRPPLSKALLAGMAEPEDLLLLPRAWYADHDVELLLGRVATAIDPANRTVSCGTDRLSYDDVVIATGSRARPLLTDTGWTGVHLLRSVDDALALRDSAGTAAQAVIVGGGFIGFEVASALRQRGLGVTVVEAADIPLSRVVGPEAAAVLAERARRAGVTLRCATTVTAVLGHRPTGRVRAVVLSDGSELAADLVVVGAGAVPNVEWLESSRLPAGPGGLRCDAQGRAAAHIWAVGDVSAWQTPEGRYQRHEHWTATVEQARVVAHNLATEPTRSWVPAPYVWSEQFGGRIDLVGNLTDHDSIRMLSCGTTDLAVLYARDGLFAGACVVDQPGLMARCRAWAARRVPTTELAEWHDAALAAPTH